MLRSSHYHAMHPPDKSADLASSQDDDNHAQEKSCVLSSYKQNAASAIFYGLGTAADTYQFYTGLLDSPGTLLGFINIDSNAAKISLTSLCALETFVFNRTYTQVGIEKLQNRLQNNEEYGEWELLPAPIEKKALGISALVNLYAYFADTVAVAYYIHQRGYGLHRAFEFILGALACISTLPTENYETYLAIQKKFSVMDGPLKLTFELLINAEPYLTASPKHFEELSLTWHEFTLYLKQLMLDPDHASYLDATGTMLSNLLIPILRSQDKATIYLGLQLLKMDTKIADKFAKLFSNLNQRIQSATDEEKNAIPTTSIAQNICEILATIAKIILKICGPMQDLVEAYSCVAAMFLVTSPVAKWIILLLSISNGVTDFYFNGVNSSNAIDDFRKSFEHGLPSYKKIIAFMLSVFSSAVLGNTQANLILSILSDPEATLPAPLPPILPYFIALPLGWGTALRESVNFAGYFYPFFSMITHYPEQKLSRYWNAQDYDPKHFADQPSLSHTDTSNEEGYIRIDDAASTSKFAVDHTLTDVDDGSWSNLEITEIDETPAITSFGSINSPLVNNSFMSRPKSAQPFPAVKNPSHTPRIGQ